MDSDREKTIANLVFGWALALILTMAALYLWNIIRWGTQPDAGFYRRSATGKTVVGVVTDLGRQAGIQLGDRILKVNGLTFEDTKEFQAARNWKFGERNTYLLERQGRQFEVTIINIPLGFKEAFIRSGLPYVVGLCYVAIGILVLLMKPLQRASRIFFLVCTVFGLLFMFILKLGEMWPSWFGTVHIFLYTYAPAVLIHLALAFPEERSFIKKLPSLQFYPYLGSTFLFIGIRSATSLMSDVPRAWFIILISSLALAIFAFIGSCFHLWLTSSSEIAKLRAKMIILGAAISSVSYISDALLNALFHVYLVPNFNYHLPFLLAFPFFIGYSIIKHNLFDIDGTIRRTFGYILATIGIASIYTLSVFIPTLIFGKFEFAGTALFPVIFILVLLFLFNLARNRIHKFVDRVFYRLEYDYQETVQRISESLRSLLSLDQIGKRMMEVVSNVLYAEKGSLMLLDSKGEAYRPLTDPSSKLTVSADDRLVQRMGEKGNVVTQYDIEEDPLFEGEKELCKRTFDRLEAALIVPLIYENRLIGWLSLGNKKSGKFYRQQDINLLKTLANQAAIAIENARLHQARIEALEHSRKELERLNRAKSIALDHLSHELRTPLSVIQGSIRILKHRLGMQLASGKESKSFETLERQLHRLSDIQQETDEIIRSYPELKEEPISLFPFTEHAIEKVKQRASHREIHFHLDGQKDLSLLVAPKILADILEGLLKNAIENTPDEGMIRVVLEQKAEWILLKVQDFGIGITQENQRHLFEGLFHTQDTELYASKKPYDFNAGGKGLDLLKMKVYGQHLGFDISVGSQRCTHLPMDQDLCPGRISLCSPCRETKDCLSSGGSTFCVTFSIEEGGGHGKEGSSF
jgi:signal transduction histidine kinase